MDSRLPAGNSRRAWLLACLVLLSSTAVVAATLHGKTETFYQGYLQRLEDRLSKRSQFLLSDKVPGLREKLKSGEIYVEEARPENEPPDGLIHHYEGAIFLPGATLPQVMRVIQDYDRHKHYYKPEVIDSKILNRNGDEFRIRLRLLKKKVVTVVLETEHEVRYKPVGAKKMESLSRSTKISEVENPGSSNEEQLPPGKGNGFVWHLDSFWRFEEADGGVYMECTSVSLSRDIPFGMGRIVRPIIADLPEESLKSVLLQTRQAAAR